MASIRKKYDKINQEKLYYENKTQRLREEVDNLKGIKNKLEANKLNGFKKVK